jgi:ribonuclease P protein component
MRDQYRLKKSADFRRVYGSRHRRDGRLVAVYSRPNQLSHPRFGFSVSTKVGGATVRNAVKRRLREACRQWLQEAGSDGIDLVLVARPEAARVAFGELSGEVKALLGRSVTGPVQGLDGAGRGTAP